MGAVPTSPLTLGRLHQKAWSSNLWAATETLANITIKLHGHVDSDGTEAFLHSNAHLSHWNGENLIVVRNVSRALLGRNYGTINILCPKGVSHFQETASTKENYAHRSRVKMFSR